MQKFRFEDVNGARLNFHASKNKTVYFFIEDHITIPSVGLNKEDVLEIISSLQKIVQDGRLD